jgi:hypothetical protein
MNPNIDTGRTTFHTGWCFLTVCQEALVAHDIQASTMDVLTLFGLVAVTAMLIFYALENHSPWFTLAFAAACAMASAPFGIIEAIWAGVATRRWRTRMLIATTA